MAEDKTSNAQPQSGADKDEKKDFRQLPEDKNSDEVGQDNKGLAPMLHWDVDKSDDD
jgi:hypothetical protein